MAVVQSVGMKVLTILVGIPVSRVVRKLVSRLWTTARPEQPPTQVKQPGVQWGDAIAWAALSAVGIVVTQLVTRRGAEAGFRLFFRQDPPPPKPGKAEKKMQKKARKRLGKAARSPQPVSA